MTVKGNHPLAEIIARKLFGIESVPKAEQGKMVNRAIKAAVEYHEKEIERKDRALRKVLDGRSTLNINTLRMVEAALSTKEDSDGTRK